MPKLSPIKAIQEQIKKLQAKAESLKARNKTPALQTIVKLIRENDISISEVSEALDKKQVRRGRGAAVKATKAAKPAKPVAIKYRGPASNQTWTGRGRTPRWIVDAEAAGKNRTEFLVGTGAS